MSLELEKLLAVEIQVGTYHSTGTFSIALSEARRKLQKYQLPSLAAHIMKLLQGVIQLEPGAIWIECDAEHFALYWGDPDIDLSSTFLAQLEQVVLGPARPERDLAIGLLGFLAVDPEQVWWCAWEKAGAREVKSLHGQASEARVRAPLSVYRRTCALVVQGKLSVEREAVAQAACFAPVQILWNGRLLSEARWKVPGESTYWLDYYLTQSGPLARGLALKPLGTCQCWTYPPDASDWADFAPRPGAQPVMQRQLQIEKTRRLDFISATQNLRTSLGEAIWVVRGHSDVASQLWCVKHGILLKAMDLPIPISGLLVVVATPDLEVDLGQFQPLTTSPGYRALENRVIAQALALTQSVRATAPRQERLADGIPKSLAAIFAAGLALGSWCMPELCLLVGPLSGAGAVAAAQKWKGMVRQTRVSQLEDRLERLRLALPDRP